ETSFLTNEGLPTLTPASGSRAVDGEDTSITASATAPTIPSLRISTPPADRLTDADRYKRAACRCERLSLAAARHGPQAEARSRAGSPGYWHNDLWIRLRDANVLPRGPAGRTAMTTAGRWLPELAREIPATTDSRAYFLRKSLRLTTFAPAG